MGKKRSFAKCICGQVSINTLKRPVIDAQSKSWLRLDRHPSWYSVDTWRLINSGSKVHRVSNWVTCINPKLNSWLLTNCELKCWLSVNQGSIEGWSSINQGYWSTHVKCWYSSFSCCCVICNFFFELWSFSFDRVEPVSDITKTVLLTADIGTKLNGTVDT